MRITRIIIGLIPLFWLMASSNVNAAQQYVNIATSARLSSSPEIPVNTLRKLIDGNERSGIAFPVGSEGDGNFIFTFLRLRKVSGLRFRQTSNVYYTTRYEVLADKDGDGKFETKLAASKASPPGEWSDCEWEPVNVHALKLVSVEGVSKGRRAHPVVSEVEIFGRALPTDTEDAKQIGNPINTVSKVRDIVTWIDLSGKTRPVAILCPKQTVYLNAARTIADAIRKLGVPRPLVTTDAKETLPDRYNVIALGNVNDNELIARLYFNYYAYEDSLIPGPDGYSIRTIYDPYPWHRKGDVVIIGVSDKKHILAGAQAFISKIKPGKTPAGIDYTLIVSTARPLTEAQQRSLDSQRTPSFRVFLSSASQYLKTGNESYARHAIATLERIVELYKKEPDHDCDWPEETNSSIIMATWDAFEECPLMTAGQRYRFTLAFLKFMRVLVRHVSGYSRVGKDDLVTWNHTTFPLLGLYFGSRYFYDYYGLTEAETHLNKARACFLAQAKSWKPQEDADSYLIITMRHAIRYGLAEWNLDFFRSGLMRQYADYVIGICDSAGLPSGFGDSGIGRNPTLIKAVLPLAFWWYRDPGYFWVLQHVLGASWQNPFHLDVTPQQPDRYTGVRVFPLDPQLYEYTKRYPFYNEPRTPPNVPPEAAFDKIAFRESWDKKAQYLLLDGYSRGKHLHYDGNAIIEFVDRGKRWLIDHDYLTRNTTEHNMLSVIRDGRSTELMPSCAGLQCVADTGGRIGFVGTKVLNYLGIDWRRYIFWRKGDAFIVMDRMTARTEANYDLDITWKVEDQGDERLVGDNAFMVRRAATQGRTRDISVIIDDQASGNKAALFGQATSVLGFVVDLPGGEYALSIRAYGMDGSSDSLFVITDSGEQVAFHVPQLKYGPTSAKFDHSLPTPRVKFIGDGRHLVTVMLRERPPVRVDKFTFFSADGKRRLELEAEEVTPPSEDDLAKISADRFWIKWPDPVQTTVARAKPKGIVVPVRKLYQRISRHLKPGDSVEIANLLYVDDSRAQTDYRIERVCPGAVVMRGTEDALVAIRGVKIPGLTFDAEMLYLSSSRLAWAKGRSLRIGDAVVNSNQVSNLEIDLPTQKVTAQTSDGQTVSVQTTGLSADAIRVFLKSLKASIVRESGEEQRPAQPIRMPGKESIAWRTRLESSPIRRLKLADLNGDGNPEILVAAGQGAYALSSDGRILWTYLLAGACYDLEAGDLTADAGMEVAVAGGDTYVHLLNSSGKLISKHQIRGPVWSQNFGDRPWEAYTVAVRDLDGDKHNEILVGTQNYELRIYDASWKQLARTRRAVLHGSIDFHTVDVNRDGKLEIFATDHYGHLQMFSYDGTRVGSFYTSIGDMQATFADLDGDGYVEAVYGSSTGDMVCSKLSASGSWWRGAKTLWRFNNFGYGVNRLRASDIDGDGNNEVIVASQTGYLYVLDDNGRVRWQDRAGTDVAEVIILSGAQPRLAYFDRTGILTLATGDGKIRRRVRLDFRPVVAIQLREYLVVGAANEVVSFKIDELWKLEKP